MSDIYTNRLNAGHTALGYKRTFGTSCPAQDPKGYHTTSKARDLYPPFSKLGGANSSLPEGANSNTAENAANTVPVVPLYSDDSTILVENGDDVPSEPDSNPIESLATTAEPLAPVEPLSPVDPTSERDRYLAELCDYANQAAYAVHYANASSVSEDRKSQFREMVRSYSQKADHASRKAHIYAHATKCSNLDDPDYASETCEYFRKCPFDASMTPDENDANCKAFCQARYNKFSSSNNSENLNME